MQSIRTQPQFPVRMQQLSDSPTATLHTILPFSRDLEVTESPLRKPREKPWIAWTKHSCRKCFNLNFKSSEDFSPFCLPHPYVERESATYMQLSKLYGWWTLRKKLKFQVGSSQLPKNPLFETFWMKLARHGTRSMEEYCRQWEKVYLGS